MPPNSPTVTAPLSRDLYAREGLRYLPNILTMLDQNPFSPTYGCGDRPYWLYKSVDYPCGMYGEFCLPLALAYSQPFPDNPYYGQPRIRDLSIAVIRDQMRNAHKDSSNDDFYPWEKAVGSTAFTLFAMAETVRILSIKEDDIIAFLEHRARWLCTRQESGRLTNHHALVALGVGAVHRLTGSADLDTARKRVRDTVLSWQSEEGWFPEYDGFDPGYHTFTISFLSYLRTITGDDSLTQPLGRAVELAANFIGPDGSYGGEMGSRNSYHFLPHGFELLASEFGAARYVADLFLSALSRGTRSFLDENRTFCHYQYNFMQAWLDFADRDTLPNWQPPSTVQRYPEAGMLTLHRNGIHAAVSARKGGVIKASTVDGPLASDTGLIAIDTKGVMFAHSVACNDEVKVTDTDDGQLELELDVTFDQVPNTLLPTTFRLFVLRLISLTIGRIEPNLLRKTIQYLLIKRRRSMPVRSTRRIRIGGDQIVVEDNLRRSGNGADLARLASSTDLTTIYTASSNPWHVSRFFTWIERPTELVELNESAATHIKRIWKR